MNSVFCRSSQTANANMPLKRRRHSVPHSSQAWTMTSVSLRVRNVWPRASSSASTSMKLKISPLNVTTTEPSSL
jgi:hypothetical protein